MSPILRQTSVVALLLLSLSQASAFVSPAAQFTKRSSSTVIIYGQDEEKKGGFGTFWEEVDAFVDDAMNRRLGSGAAFYGKRKSNFYGKNDKKRKVDRNTPDPLEDYQGPNQAGYFKWKQDENGEIKPVTRLKEKNIERNPNFWDKFFGDEKK